MDAHDWDERYGRVPALWSAAPNVFVVQETAHLRPGRALDLAGGEGRNALWLAEQGWQVDLVDFSTVALQRAAEIAAQRLGAAAGASEQRLGAAAGSLSCLAADLADWVPAADAYDLVLVVYLQVPAQLRTKVLRRAAAALAPGGTLVVVAHHARNLQHGFGGPQDPLVLYSEDEVKADLAGSALTIIKAAEVAREVQDAPRPALDLRVVAQRPPVVDKVVVAQRPPVVDNVVVAQRQPALDQVVVAQRQPALDQVVVAQRQPAVGL